MREVVVGGVGMTPFGRFLETTVADLAARATRFKRPRQWRIVAELPKSLTGKVLKRRLRDAVASQVIGR